MSSQLHQAVERAQAGQRDEARRLLWEYLQTDPNNTVAWLWLASVAADQPEYVRALKEVLRIDPTHARARQLLDDFQRQYGSVPGASTPPFARPSAEQQGPPGRPPAERPYQPPPPPPATPSYQPPSPGTMPQAQEVHGYEPPRYEPEDDEPRKPKPRPYEGEREVVRERVIERRGRRGCGCLPVMPGCGCLGCGGCGQSCLVALVLLIVLPAVFFGMISYANFSLGPLDFPTSYLPGEFGTKSIKFESGNYEIDLNAPRSWYLVSEQNDTWLLWRDILNQGVRFEDEARDWEDFEEQQNSIILEADPIRLNMSGDVIKLELLGPVERNFRCDAVSTPGEVIRHEDGLCGTLIRQTVSYNGGPAFRDSTAPVEWTTATFTVPVNESLALEWQFEVAADMWSFYDERIRSLAETMQVKQK